MKFSIDIPCKPYVKRFLEINYGLPVDFTKDNSIYPLFRKKLEKKSFEYEKRYAECKMSKYTETVEVKITSYDFYKYGWELSLNDKVAFNKEIEGKAKLFMYLIVSTRLSFGMSLVDSIKYFQLRFDFPEEVWPTESIVKDCQRNLTVQKNEIIEHVSELIDKIITLKLSEKRTTSVKTKKQYENATI
jgi:hypothetical protein